MLFFYEDHENLTKLSSLLLEQTTLLLSEINRKHILLYRLYQIWWKRQVVHMTTIWTLFMGPHVIVVILSMYLPFFLSLSLSKNKAVLEEIFCFFS